MNISLKLAIGAFFASTVFINFSSAATADQIRKVGMVAIIYDANNNISSIASSIAIGKNVAAGTASIAGNEAATSAVGGAGILTVTNQNTVNVGYELTPESPTNLGTISTTPSNTTSVRITTNNPQVITAITVIP
jgi:hypothetical protein